MCFRYKRWVRYTQNLILAGLLLTTLPAAGQSDFIIFYRLDQADPRLLEAGLFEEETLVSLRDTVWETRRKGLKKTNTSFESTSISAQNYHVYIRHSFKWATVHTQPHCETDTEYPEDIELESLRMVPGDTTILGYPCKLYEATYLEPVASDSPKSVRRKVSLTSYTWITDQLQPYLYQSFKDTRMRIDGTLTGIKGIALQVEYYGSKGKIITRSVATKVLVGPAAAAFTFAKDIPPGYFVEHYVCPDN